MRSRLEALKASDAFASGAIRALATVVTGATAIFATRAVVQSDGVSGFAYFAVVATLPTVLAFSDLGFGGAVTEAVATRAARTAAATSRLVARSARLLSYIAFVLVIFVLAGTLGGWFPRLLPGGVHGASFGLCLVVLVFALGMPFSLGYRALLGFEMNRVVILIQSLASFFGYGSVIIAAMLGIPLYWFVVLPVLWNLLGALLASLLARRAWRRFIDASDRDPVESGGPVFSLVSTAVAMAVIMVTAPAVFQVDRIILGATSSAVETARYSAALQVFAPVYGVLLASGQSLWPRFSRRRDSVGPESTGLRASLVVFTILSCSAAAALLVIGPPITAAASRGQATAEFGLFLGMGTLLVVLGGSLPLGMYFMSPKLVRVQAALVLVFATAKLLIAVTFASMFGGAGLVYSTAGLYTIIVVMPMAVLAASSSRASKVLGFGAR